ncbi:tripartite tricarboxylate transporter TctB family protein [Microbacterium sp. HMH0099]|uniref:tripartite tricarboxylate transporter TctB family protein n=1 Tax=Microbacterium sp. HMH0099 TaxID=3414026 RepID=UPI003BF7D569
MSATVGNRLRLSRGGGLVGLVKSLAMPLVLAAFATYLVVGIVTMRVPPNAAFPGPQFFPGIIAAGLYVFAIVLGIGAVRAIGGTPDAAEPDERAVGVDWRSFAWVVGSFLAFAFLLGILGWIIAAALLFTGIARGFGQRNVLFALFVGVTISSLTYIAFDMGLGLSLPSGILGWAF